MEQYQELFNYMSDQHDVTLLLGDMQEIERIILDQKETIIQAEDVFEKSKL